VEHEPVHAESDGAPASASIALYQKVLGGLVAVLILVIVLVWHSRLATDFWPPDSSRIAPNLVASVIQWAVVLLVAALIWPPTRRKIHAFVDGKLHKVHEGLEDLHSKHNETHQMLEHIIHHHPDIPDFKKDDK
jgi:hypothetical protein